MCIYIYVQMCIYAYRLPELSALQPEDHLGRGKKRSY